MSMNHKIKRQRPVGLFAEFIKSGYCGEWSWKEEERGALTFHFTCHLGKKVFSHPWVLIILCKLKSHFVQKYRFLSFLNCFHFSVELVSFVLMLFWKKWSNFTVQDMSNNKNTFLEPICRFRPCIWGLCINL